MMKIVFLWLLCVTLSACQKTSLLDQVRSSGELVVITRNSPTTYYEGTDGPTGFEYDLANLFAEHLGVTLKLVVPPNFGNILPLITRGDAHLAAAGLTITEKRKETIRFGPVYQKITPELVYHVNNRRPKDLSEVKGHLEVLAGSSHAERLSALQENYPQLSWDENEELESEELLYLLWQLLIDYTVADSNELAVNRSFYPELRIAFSLADPEPLAWAFAKTDDTSLVDEATIFFDKLVADGTLNQLLERYYGHIQEFDYVDNIRYKAHIEQRLPIYRDMFIEAADKIGMDWRLLAAIGYQESHWNPDAVSPTGVRGIMMLTQNTARDIGIKNRLDPQQSIEGGARYIQRMINRIPERVPEPDRTWLALAAYNVGIGHLEDARILTQKNHSDFDKWVDVRESLPLLSKKKWFQQTRYGYARGREPVRYVENIRTYYDILVWYTERDLEKTEVPRPLMLDSPAI